MKKIVAKTGFGESCGFTLVELLIVIALIAILMSLGIVVYFGQQKSARDAKRRADVEAIVIAFEQKYEKTDKGKYDAVQNSDFSNALPKDPLSGQDYTFTPPLNTFPSPTYLICALLENIKGNSTSNNSITPPATPESGQYYCKTNQQS